MKIKKNEKEVWTGTYKGVAFEIDKWKTKPNDFDLEGRDCWTYYLFLHLNKIPKENNPKGYWLEGIKDKKRVYYKYNKHNVMNELDWHGGLTWYSKEHGFDKSGKIIKIGCDYSHYYDEGYCYNLETVKNDVKNTIERFLYFVPDYKYWCCGNGNLYSLNEGVVKGGRFYSKEYFGEKEWFKELKKQ